MSYALKWMLERGMLITEDDLDYLADPSMPLVKAWHRTPLRGRHRPGPGQGLHRRHSVWVDWDYPDPAGYREHRILNWLEIHNTAWEEQYFEIMDFLDHYDIVLRRRRCPGHGFRRGRPHAAPARLPLSRSRRYQSTPRTRAERWKHLIQLIQRQMLVYPGHSKARRTRVWRGSASRWSTPRRS